MHSLHDYVAKQLADKIRSRRVVIWYDERGEFQSFVDEVRGGPRAVSEPVPVAVAGAKATLAEFSGSLFELRAVVEPHVSGDTPAPVVVYVPGVTRDRRASVLMELEKAGTTWEPQLKQLAKNVLLQKYTLGIVDEMLPFDRKVSYEDLARAAAGNSGTEPPSILKSIFHDASGNDGLLTAWLVSDARDADIVSKGATRELTKLVKARLGLDLVVDSPLSKLRTITLRYVLAGEFRLDLSCDAPASLDGVRKPPTKDEESAVREIAQRLRSGHADAYAALADRIEEELGLKNAKLPPGSLGAIDTFRFEERALLSHAGDLIASGRYGEALRIVAEREQSFWLDRDVSRKAQWEAARRIAELGMLAGQVQVAVAKSAGAPANWLAAYVGEPGKGDGWYRLDQAQRHLEAWVATLDEPDERALGIVRRTYENVCHVMTDGFSKALAKAGWAPGASLHQTQVFSEVVSKLPKPVAYFFVDAMRFEMGAELADRLPKASEVSVRAAVGSLPSITPIGMAALMPGASASFSVVEQEGKLGASIDGSFLPDLGARKKFAAARIPNLVDLTLDELLGLPQAKLRKKLERAQVVIVRSQEIDEAGENVTDRQARRIMNEVLGDLAMAVQRLARVGIEDAVLSSDHGHLFALERDESMRTDPPGGKTIDLHRRCWIGRGGSTPPGCVRVSASALGYSSDLEFVFPTGSGVFRAGGDLAFHHGGPSLQELVIPVVTVKTRIRDGSASSAEPVTAGGLPEAVTNRIFSVTLTLGARQMKLGATGLPVRALLVSGGKQVGAVGMALDAEFDRMTGCVRLEPGRPVTIAFLLSDEGVSSLRVVVQDPSTDAELYRSPTDIPVRLGV
jgi:hypothetical protein